MSPNHLGGSPHCWAGAGVQPRQGGHSLQFPPGTKVSNQTGVSAVESPSFPPWAWLPPRSARGPGGRALNRKPRQATLHHTRTITHRTTLHRTTPHSPGPACPSPVPAQWRLGPKTVQSSLSAAGPLPGPTVHLLALGAHFPAWVAPHHTPSPVVCFRVLIAAIRKGKPGIQGTRDQHAPTHAPAQPSSSCPYLGLTGRREGTVSFWLGIEYVPRGGSEACVGWMGGWMDGRTSGWVSE